MSVTTFGGLPVTVGGIAAETAIVSVPVGALARVGSNQGATTAPAGTVYSVYQAFNPGEVPAGSVVTVEGAPTQVSGRKTYADGSLLGAQVLWAHPHAIAPSASDTINFTVAPGTWDDTPATPLSAVTAHDFKMQLVIGGVTYTLAFNSLPVATEGGAVETTFLAKGDFLDPSGAAQGQLWGRFYVTVDVAGTIRVDGKIHCNKLASAGALAATSYALLDGAAVLFSNAMPFTLHTSNVVFCFDVDGVGYTTGFDDRAVIWAQDMARLAAANLILPMTVSPDMIAAFPRVENAYVPNSVAFYPGGVDGTGGAPNIGIVSQWDADALVSGLVADVRQARRAALALCNLGTYWNVDFATGLPPVLNATTYPGLPAPTPSLGWGNQPSFTLTGGALPQASDGSSHAPHAFWGTFLMSGRRLWRDMLAEQTIGVLGYANPTTLAYGRNATIAGKKNYGLWANFGTMRAVCWQHRNASNTLAVLPDNDPLRPYIADLIAGNWQAMADLIAANASTWGALGIYDSGDWKLSGYFPMACPWMHGFQAAVTALAILRGEIPIDHPIVTQHIIPWTWGMAVNGSYFNALGAYRLGLGIGPAPVYTSTYAQQWSDVYGFSDQTGGGDVTPLLLTPEPTSGFNPSQEQFLAGGNYPTIAYCGAKAMIRAGVRSITDYADKVMAYCEATGGTNAASTDAQWGKAGIQWNIAHPGAPT